MQIKFHTWPNWTSKWGFYKKPGFIVIDLGRIDIFICWAKGGIK